MSDVEQPTKMPLEEVQATEEYARLTPKQRLWVSTYIQSGVEHGDYNPLLATRTAFACKSDENARIMAYSVMENIHIIEVLNLHFRRDPIAAFIKLIDRAIRNKRVTHPQVQLLRLKCDLLRIPTQLPVTLGDEDAYGHTVPENIKKVPVISSQKELRQAGRKSQKNPKKAKGDSPVVDTSSYGFRKKRT